MLASETQVNPQLIVLCKDATLAARFSGILEERFRVSVQSTTANAMQFIKKHSPQMIILDAALLKSLLKNVISEISAASPLSRIVVIEGPAERTVDQMALFKCGAHGFFADNISPTLLAKAVDSVSRGEVWVPRKLFSRLLVELAKGKAASEARLDPAARESMGKLTPRELEVARMVHAGGNNKMIARQLDISERTVKAHLSAIFRKLNIENRLHLALFFNEMT